MLLKLYVNESSDNTINKVLSEEEVFNINLKNDFNPTEPTFLISSVNDLKGFNYLYLDDLNRYYFINSIECIRFNLYKINCYVDLLETYKTDILNSNSEYLRKIKVGDYIDSNLDLSVKTKSNIYTSNVIFNDVNDTVMVTIGE